MDKLIFCLTLLFLGCGPREITIRPAQSQKAVEQAIAQFGEVENTVVDEYLRSLEGRLGQAVPPTKISQIHIAVLNTSRPLALSAANGYLLISRGLVTSLANEAELAFIVSHELAHSILGHHHNLPEAEIPETRGLKSEIEADRMGIEITAAAAFDPRVATLVIERLGNSVNGPGLSENELTERIVAAEDELKLIPVKRGMTLNRRDFMEFQRTLSSNL